MEQQQSTDGARRILVVANETATGRVLHDTIRERTRDVPAQVLVVAPALNRRVRHWASDDRAARRAAAGRVAVCVDRLRSDGMAVEGLVGDGDPLVAIDDAVFLFDPHEIVVSTHPEGRSHWLARRLVDKVRVRHDLPVLHIVVDTAAREEYVAA